MNHWEQCTGIRKQLETHEPVSQHDSTRSPPCRRLTHATLAEFEEIESRQRRSPRSNYVQCRLPGKFDQPWRAEHVVMLEESVLYHFNGSRAIKHDQRLVIIPDLSIGSSARLQGTADTPLERFLTTGPTEEPARWYATNATRQPRGKDPPLDDWTRMSLRHQLAVILSRESVERHRQHADDMSVEGHAKSRDSSSGPCTGHNQNPVR